MFIDGLSYLGNLAADMNTDPRSKKQMELVVAGLSLTLLLGFTLVFFFDALNEVFSQSISHDDDTVNAKIVLAFALLGLLFDLISLAAFYCLSDSSLLSFFMPKSLDTQQPVEQVVDEKAKDLNVLSALLHIWSDLLRSLTTLVEAIVILTEPSFVSGKVDGVCALIVCSIITLTALAAIISWIKELQLHIEGDIVTNKESMTEYSSLSQSENDDKDTIHISI